jgi:hypothetical protein
MHAAMWDGPGLRDLADPQVLNADELRRAIAIARRVTARVRDGWFDLTPDEVREVISLESGAWRARLESRCGPSWRPY